MVNPYTATTKDCGGCSVDKPLSEFSKGASRFGLRSVCKSCCVVTAQTYQKAHPRGRFLAMIWRKYGLRVGDYDGLLQQQGHSCAACRTPFGLEKRNTPCVDHDHETWKVRGLLCWNCNIILGKVQDRIETLQALIIYLESSK